MSSEAPHTVFTVCIEGPHKDMGRCDILDAGNEWIFQFGVEGNNLGMWVVTLVKMDYSHLNIWGLIEVALTHSPASYRNCHYAGERLVEGPPPKKEIES